MPEKARQETIAYHEDYYARHALFDSDSWLARPDQDMMSLAAKIGFTGGSSPIKNLCKY